MSIEDDMRKMNSDGYEQAYVEDKKFWEEEHKRNQEVEKEECNKFVEAYKQSQERVREFDKVQTEIPGLVERYMQDITEYLKSYSPNTPLHDIKTIATYCANRFTVSMADVLAARDKEWRRIVEKDNNRTCKEIDRMHRQVEEARMEVQRAFGDLNRARLR